MIDVSEMLWQIFPKWINYCGEKLWLSFVTNNFEVLEDHCIYAIR